MRLLRAQTVLLLGALVAFALGVLLWRLAGGSLSLMPSGGCMRRQRARWPPFVLAGVLLPNLTNAIANDGRVDWLLVALAALALTLSLWMRGRAH